MVENVEIAVEITAITCRSNAFSLPVLLANILIFGSRPTSINVGQSRAVSSVSSLVWSIDLQQDEADSFSLEPVPPFIMATVAIRLKNIRINETGWRSGATKPGDGVGTDGAAVAQPSMRHGTDADERRAASSRRAVCCVNDVT